MVLTSPIIGILLLDFEGYSSLELEASPGDPGLGPQPIGFLDNPDSWGCRTVFRVAKGCSPEVSALGGIEAGGALNEAAKALEDRVDLITTDCAYTYYAPDAFTDIKTRVFSSSLYCLEMARQVANTVAVLSSSAVILESLMKTIPDGVRIIDLEHYSEWNRYTRFTFNSPPLNRGLMAEELLDAVENDLSDNGIPGSLILECTGLPQFRGAIRELYDGPIFDVSSSIHQILDIQQPTEALFTR